MNFFDWIRYDLLKDKENKTLKEQLDAQLADPNNLAHQRGTHYVDAGTEEGRLAARSYGGFNGNYHEPFVVPASEEMRRGWQTPGPFGSAAVINTRKAAENKADVKMLTAKGAEPPVAAIPAAIYTAQGANVNGDRDNYTERNKWAARASSADFMKPRGVATSADYQIAMRNMMAGNNVIEKGTAGQAQQVEAGKQRIDAAGMMNNATANNATAAANQQEVAIKARNDAREQWAFEQTKAAAETAAVPSKQQISDAKIQADAEEQRREDRKAKGGK